MKQILALERDILEEVNILINFSMVTEADILKEGPNILVQEVKYFV